jgi:ferredoxin
VAEASGEAAADALLTTDIRARAGWSKEGHLATPKIAALIAEAALPQPETMSVTLESAGVCLIYGQDDTAIEAASQLGDRLDVTVLLTRPGDIVPPARTSFPVVKGTIRAAKGQLGGFEIVVDDYALPDPSSRASLRFGPPRNEAVSRCDIIIDLAGGTPLFPAYHKRDGYLRADPGDPAAVQRALFAASDLVGTFDKPRYVDFRADLCAHSRNQKVGCTRCLDVCPTGAIAPAGDHVAIDGLICAGCGGCHAVCPTGAAAYAYPPADHLLERVRTLLDVYHRAGGRDAVLLVHETSTAWRSSTSSRAPATGCLPGSFLSPSTRSRNWASSFSPPPWPWVQPESASSPVTGPAASGRRSAAPSASRRPFWWASATAAVGSM